MATVNTANSFIPWSAVQGFCRDDDHFYTFDATYNTHVDGLYKFDLDGLQVGSNLSPFSNLPNTSTWRFSDGCVKDGVIYALIHSVEADPLLEIRHLTKYSAATLAFLSTVDITATGAGGAGVGFAANGNLVYADFSLTLSSTYANTIVETTTNGVYVTSHTLSDYIYGQQGVTYDKDREVYYISSHDLLNGVEQVVTVDSDWNVLYKQEPSGMSLEQEGLEYYSPNLLISEIAAPPRYMELPTTQVNNNTDNKAFTYTLPAIPTSYNNATIFLDESAFPPDSIDGSVNGFLNRGVNLRAFTDPTMTVELAVDITTFEIGNAPRIRMYITLPTAATGEDIYILSDDTITTERADSAAFGGDAAWVKSLTVLTLPFPNFGSIPDKSGVNANYTLNNFVPINESGAYGFSGRSLQQVSSQQLAGETSFYLHALCNSGTLTITGENSPHRLHDSLCGAWAVGLTTTHFAVWNQGWKYIPFSAGNDVDLDLYLTYDGSTYTLYNNGTLVGTVAHSQAILASGTGDGYIGNFAVGTDRNWAGSISYLDVGLGVPSADQVLSEYNNRIDAGGWGISSSFDLVVPVVSTINNLQYGALEVLDVKYYDGVSMESVEMEIDGVTVWRE